MPAGSPTTLDLAGAIAQFKAGDSQSFQKFEADVEAHLPRPLLTPTQRANWIASYRAMAACMRAHGIVDFPDPPPSFGDGKTPPPLIGGVGNSDLNTTSAQFQKASADCPTPSLG
jgi:hypothetical protein